MTLAPQRLTGVRVLYVDDDADTLALMAFLLGVAGATVVAVGSADEAVAAFDREQPDVLISDVQMPGRDGWGLIEHVRTWSRARGGKTPAIAVTGSAPDADIAHSLLSGFDAHLSKPIEVDELVRLIASLVDRGGISHGVTP
jgi:CheY-like chemotaxis protein